MIDYPNPPSGNGLLFNWLRRLIAAARANRIIDGPGYRRRFTTTGMILDIDAQSGAGVGISSYRFKVHHGNYIEARTWDGTTEGSDLVKIAKPHELMSGLTSQIIDSITWTYSAFNDSAQTRHVVGSDGTTEDQVIVPRYTVDSLVWAMPAKSFVATTGVSQVNGGALAEIALIDLNRAGRVYAQA